MDAKELREWESRFAAEMQLRGASPTQVGQALLEVRAHCHDAMVHPDEAFGDPVRHAAHLRPGPVAGGIATQGLREVVPLLAFVGGLALPHGMGATHHIPLTLGVVLLPAVLCAWSVLGTWLTHVTRRWWPWWAASLVMVGGAMVADAHLHRALLHLPLWTLWLGEALLLASSAWFIRQDRQRRPRDPATGEALEWTESPGNLQWSLLVFPTILLMVSLVMARG